MKVPMIHLSHHHLSSSDVTREEILKSTLELIKDFKTAISIGHSKVIVDRKMIQHGHNMEAFRRLVQSNDHLQDTKLAQKLLDYLLDKIAEAMLKLNALPHYNRSSKISEMERELSSENLALEKMLNKTEEIMRKEKLQRGVARFNSQTLLYLLGVGKEATSSEIRSAYRRKARKYHPDKHPGKEDKYTRKMQKVTEAYSMLSDKKRRANYDWELKSKGKYH
ncbi:dnaJ domain-containing protein [Ditylenchus destructor]|uniref:DnaJ domain-containing protein n=1 Tax=Ditylenchus destructor TaxID=166010 RepID=A0AAD4MGD5_9BILA|nr:dnaJ domain-containing protein [Ditylenchus destructor]